METIRWAGLISLILVLLDARLWPLWALVWAIFIVDAIRYVRNKRHSRPAAL
jgi:hypothetical protein